MLQSEILPPPATQALISLSAFRHNMSVVRAYIGPIPRIMAVVKANAYGHGAEKMAHEAMQGGATFLGVARVHEGVELRRAGVDAPILVFEVPLSDQIGTALHHRLALTVSSDEGAARVSEMGVRLGVRGPVHVKIDTGMSRLGFPHGEAEQHITRIVSLPGLTLEGVYSHFATSDEEDTGYALTQLERFNGVIARLESLGLHIPLKHMANSGAIISMPQAHFDLVRPGIMLYGYAPRPGMPQRFPLQQVMNLSSRVVLIKPVSRGTSVSYSRRYTTQEDTRIATVPIGYADGYSRLLTNRATALIKGRRYPVVGTICMDQLMIDVGGESDVREGDEVVLMGRSGEEVIDADDIARTIGTINYEVTCLVTRRVPRTYVE